MTATAPPLTNERYLFRVEFSDLPPREATKNYHGHWKHRHTAVQSFREAASWAIKDELFVSGWDARLAEIPDTLDLHITVWWPKGRRRLDDDGIRSALAPAQDALADLLGHASDHRYRVRSVQQRRCRDGDGAGTIIEVWRRGDPIPDDDGPHGRYCSCKFCRAEMEAVWRKMR